MKNMLALIGLVVVLVAGLGWYLGWYQVGVEPGADGHSKINVDVNRKKIIEDEQNLQKKVTGAVSGDTKGTTTIVPNVPTSEPKKVEGQTTGGGGFRFNPDGSIEIVTPYKNVGP